MFAAMAAAGAVGAGVAATRTQAGRRVLVKAARSNVVTRKAAGKLARVRHVIKRRLWPRTEAQSVLAAIPRRAIWKREAVLNIARSGRLIRGVTRSARRLSEVEKQYAGLHQETLRQTKQIADLESQIGGLKTQLRGPDMLEHMVTEIGQQRRKLSRVPRNLWRVK